MDEDLCIEQDRQAPFVMVVGAISWFEKKSPFFLDGFVSLPSINVFNMFLFEDVFPQMRQKWKQLDLAVRWCDYMPLWES